MKYNILKLKKLIINLIEKKQLPATFTDIKEDGEKGLEISLLVKLDNNIAKEVGVETKKLLIIIRNNFFQSFNIRNLDKRLGIDMNDKHFTGQDMEENLNQIRILRIVYESILVEAYFPNKDKNIPYSKWGCYYQEYQYYWALKSDGPDVRFYRDSVRCPDCFYYQ